jgi:hypothetical protein
MDAGFSPSDSLTLHFPAAIIAAGEALLGLLIEITLTAAFAQRFLAR